MYSIESSYVYYDSTCTTTGDRWYICTRCGAEDHGIVLKKEHDWEVRVVSEGDCMNPHCTQKTCRVCGYVGPFEDDYSECANKHHWVTVTYQEFNEVTLEWEDVTRTCCSTCNMDKPQ